MLLTICKDRGLTLTFRPDGTPIVKGPKEQLTSPLMRALKAFRERIIESIPNPLPEACPQFLEWRTTTEVVLVVDVQKRRRVPVGVTHWRTLDGEEWRVIEELPPAWGLAPAKRWPEDYQTGDDSDV